MKKANRKPYSIYMKEKNIRKFNRSLNAIITIVFIGVIFTITIFGIFKNDKEFSEQENRNLSKKPEFTLKSFVNRDFLENIQVIYLTNSQVEIFLWLLKEI